jgi:hypothetical protein
MPAGGTDLDHVGLFVPDMAATAGAMARLGFALTPYTPLADQMRRALARYAGARSWNTRRVKPKEPL